MGVVANIDIDALFKDVTDTADSIIREAIAEAFEMSFLEVQSKAKELDTYKDRTNNLRSSIGYVIYDRGEKIKSNFSQSGAGTKGDGGSGVSTGQAVAEKAALDYPDAIVGVLTAGMSYALFVEQKRRDVISGPASELKDILESNMQIVIEELSK